MIQSDLNINQSNISHTGRSAGPAVPGPRPIDIKRENTIDVQNQNPDGWVKIDRSKFPFSKKQASISNSNSVAHSIRIADQAMEKIGRHINDMKKDLKTHIKNYPPYPPGSEERVEILKSFSAFRKLIEELTIPPDDNAATRILNASSRQAEEEGVFLENEGFGKTIRSQPVGTGPDGIDIPEFPDGATDEDFEFMIEKLGNAARILEVRRAGLQTDAAGIFNSPVV